MTLALKSTAFENGNEIPSVYTCEGKDISPPLTWLGAPDGTKSFALIVDDPDAPDPAAPQRTWVHWVAYNISPATHEFSEKTNTPESQSGTNDWKRSGYGGPCLPIGRHRYFFKLYALDTLLTPTNKLNKAQLEAAMKGHILAETSLMGTYQKKKN